MKTKKFYPAIKLLMIFFIISVNFSPFAQAQDDLQLKNTKITGPEVIGIGEAYSMYVSESGKVHVFYATEDAAYYLYKLPGGTWHKTSLAHQEGRGYPLSSDIVVDSYGYVHICYSMLYSLSHRSDYPRLYYITNKDGQWTTKTIALTAGWSISMDINNENNILLFYQDAAEVATRAPFYYMKFKSDKWNNPELFNENGYEHIDVAFDKNGIAHVVYMQEYQDYICPVYQKSTNAEISDWEEPIPCPSWHGGGLEGLTPEIVIDENNDPNIIYPGSQTDRKEDINYANLGDGTWDWEVLESGNLYTRANAIDIDPEGRIHAAYYSSVNNALIYKTKNNDSRWTSMKLDDLDFSFKIAIGADNNGKINILYSQGCSYAEEIKFISLETALTRYIKISPDSLKFENVPKNSSKSLELTITNSGSKPITIDSIKIENTNFTIPFSPVTLDASETGTVNVEFHPTEDVKTNTDLKVYYNGPVPSYCSEPLIAYTILPELTLTPDNISFGAVEYNHEEIKDIIVKNTGYADLEISDVYVKLWGSTDFHLVNAGNSVIAPGDSSIVQVSFYPKITGTQMSMLHIISNDFEEPHKSVWVSGHTPYADNDVNTKIIDFGYQDISTTATQKLILYNKGDHDLEISSINLSSDVFAFSGSCSTIPPGDSCELEISFTPDKKLDFTQTMKIYSNSKYRNPLKITLKGSACLRNLTISSSDIDFGNHRVNDENAFNYLTLHNNGDFDITISSAQFAGLNYQEFKHSRIPHTIEAHSSIVDTIWFSPIFEGDKEAYLHIVSNDTYDPEINIQLHGVATASSETYTISGKIFNEDNSEEITKGSIEIYKESAPDKLAGYEIDGINAYTFTNILSGSYTVKFIPDPQTYPDKLPTYLGNVLTLAEATFVAVGPLLPEQNIYVLDNPTGGNDRGKIKGNLQKDEGGKNVEVLKGSTGLNGNALQDVNVYLYDANSNDPVGSDVTDADGYFEFTGLSNGSYRFMSDYGNVPMDPQNPVLVIDDQHDSVNIIATVYDDKVCYNPVPTGLNNAQPGLDLSIWPNPVKDNLYLKLNSSPDDKVIIRIYSIDGALVKETEYGNKKLITIPVSGLKKGIYMLEVKSKNINSYTKIMKQ